MFRNKRSSASFIGLAAVFFLTASPCQAQDYTWSVPTGGSWANGLNWLNLPGNFPNSNGSRAFFSSAGNSSAKTVTLDAAITVRRLVFNASQTGSVTLASGIGGSLTLDNSITGQPSLDVQAGSGNHTISANVVLAGPDVAKVNISTNATLTMSGSISGAQGINLQQAGTLLLNGTNSYSGATTVSAGKLGGSGSIASAVSVAVGATITAGVSPSASTLTLGNGLTLNGRYLVTLFSNTAASKLAVNSGLVTMSAGTLEVALGSGVTVASFRAAGPRSFTIVDAANGQLSGSFSATNFTTAGFLASEWSVVNDNSTGNVTLNFTPVPEPATVLGIAAVSLFAIGYLRRRHAGRLAMVVEQSSRKPVRL